MTPQGGPLDPKKAKIKSIEFRAELHMFFVYIFLVHEESLIKSYKVNIRKITREGTLWFRESFFESLRKYPYDQRPGLIFYGTLPPPLLQASTQNIGARFSLTTPFLQRPIPILLRSIGMNVQSV